MNIKLLQGVAPHYYYLWNKLALWDMRKFLYKFQIYSLSLNFIYFTLLSKPLLKHRFVPFLVCFLIYYPRCNLVPSNSMLEFCHVMLPSSKHTHSVDRHKFCHIQVSCSINCNCYVTGVSNLWVLILFTLVLFLKFV